MVRVLKTQSVQSIGYILNSFSKKFSKLTEILRKPLKTLDLSQVSFPLFFPLCYIVPSVFMNSDKGKYKGKKII